MLQSSEVNGKSAADEGNLLDLDELSIAEPSPAPAGPSASVLDGLSDPGHSQISPPGGGTHP